MKPNSCAALPTYLLLGSRLALVLLSAGALYGDTVVLTNGDKFTGAVKGLADGKLTVKLSYVDDPIEIDAKMLASVKTDKAMKASLLDGKTVSGKLEPATSAGSFLAANSAAPVEFKSVKTMVLLIPEIVPKTWKDRIASDNSLTYAYVGNGSSHTLNWYSTTEYYGIKWEPMLDLQQTLSKSQSSTTNSQSYGYITTNYYLTNKLFLYPWVSGLKENIALTGYGSLLQSGGGIGWAFNRKKEYRLLVQGGPAAETDTATLYPNNPLGQPGDTRFRRTIPVGVVGVNWNIRPDDGIQWKAQVLYSHSFDYDVRNRNRLAMNFVVSIPLAGPVTLDFQARDFANILRPGLLSLKTFYVTTGLGISF